ncbi:uncharacterized protein LOC115034057 [Acyrthosiphon pisum]|uniref:Uncharacterized protein n=1 Tax=Acyrthosiphon pisum TaxID=7029 RepID=A0A8R2NSM5_ACYPI|nr:uncharacterized protein LOC115034057 [Acyrthosiphon pisum]
MDRLNTHTNIGKDNRVLLTTCQYLFVSESTINIGDTTFPNVPMAFMPCIEIKPQPDLATHCVDDGNILLKQHNICGAINKYDQAIKERSYYAIPHYNKRIALSMQNDIPSNAITYKEIDTNLLIKQFQDNNFASKVDPYFVINIIAAVPERRFSDDSSDEEPDEEFNALYKELVNNNDWPFTTKHKKTIRTKSKILDLEPPFVYKNQVTADSIVVDPLLSKILANGFESYDIDKLPTIAVSVGLNRMYSLSTRKNNSLILELESRVNTRKIKYKTFGYYWNCSWYTKIGIEAKIEDVKTFYKRLKNKDSDLAKKFIAQEENEGAECNVPYQYIRDHAKNHSKTIELIKSFRDTNNTAILYLHLVDSDVLDFNGVYSAYLRIIAGCYKPPTVMSTGYEYPEGTRSKIYRLFSYMDRMYRVITTFHIPLGTYYPEPNMCVLIPHNCQKVDESFISPKRGKNLGSPILIEHILNNRPPNVHAIFSEDNPIIIKLPPRAKLSKISKQPLEFSPECNTGPAAPTSDDIKKFDQVSQSHSNSLTWSRSLFINKSIECDNDYETDGEFIFGKKNTRLTVNKECYHLIGNIRKNCDVESSQSKLANRIGEDNCNNIVNAIKDIEQFKKYFDKKYKRTPEEQEFFDIMKELEICYDNLSRKSLLMIIQIMHLIKDYAMTVKYLVNLDEDMLEYIINSDKIIQIMQLINNNTMVNSFADLDIEMLDYIINNDEIMQALDHKEVDIGDLINIFRDNLEDFDTARENDYGLQKILELYKQNPLHLSFMANDPYDFVYQNYDNDIIINFAINYEYIARPNIGIAFWGFGLVVI